MKNNIYFSKALRTLSAVLACFVVMMSFVGVPEAFASGASAGGGGGGGAAAGGSGASEPVLTATETVECEENVTLNGVVPGTAANYAYVGVESGSFSGGARLNLFNDNSYPAVWTITPSYTGTVSIDLVQTHTSGWTANVKFEVNGNETFNNVLSGWTAGTDRIATDISVTKRVPFTITWTPLAQDSARSFFDYFNLTYSYKESEQVNLGRPLTTNTVLTAEDAELSDGAEAIGDEVKIPVGGTATYKANEGASNKAYKLFVNLSSGTEVGIELNGEDLGIIAVPATGEDVFVCEFIAPNGANTIKLYATNEEVVVTDVKVNEIKPGTLPEVPLYDKLEAEENGVAIDGNTLAEGSSAIITDATNASGGKYVRSNGIFSWKFTPTLTGYYTFDIITGGQVEPMNGDNTFTVNGTTVYTGPIATNGSWGVANAPTTRLFKMQMEAGTTYTLSWASYPTATTVCPDYFNVYYEDAISLDINGIFVGDEALIDGKVIPRGTDALMVEFTNTVDASALGGAQITLDGVDFELEANDNELYIYLKDTLDYSTDYTLDIQNVTGAYGAEFVAPKAVTFTTSDAAGDSGLSAAEITEGSVSGADITISGIVKSSAGKGINGRTLNVKVLKDGGEVLTTSIGTSGDNGAFTYTYTAGTTLADDGLYSFSVEPEYGTWSTAKEIPYITTAGEAAALEALKGTTDQTTVDAWFVSYKAAFGLTLMDNTGISNESLLNAHFIGADYTAAGKDAFVADYADYLILERMLQGDASVVTGLLADEDACATLGIDKNKYALLTGANKTGFETALCALELSGTDRTLEKFAEEYNKLVDPYLATESTKTVPVLKNDAVTAYVNQEIEVPVAFTAEYEDLSKLTLTVTCPSADIANALTFAPVAALSNDVSATKTASGSTATFVITKKLYNDKFTTLGYLKFTSSTTGSYTFTLSGEAEIVIANADSSVKSTFTTALTAKTVTVTVSAASTDTGTGESNWSGGGGGGGGGGGSSDDKNKDDKEETKDPVTTDPVVTPSTEFKFTDLGNVDWAVESIEALLEAGIISQSEDKKYNPENNVLREEYIKMLVIALDIPETDTASGFGDVDENEWYAPFIARAKAAGLVLGNDSGNFGIGEKITRQDMATMTARALEALGLEYAENDELFADDADIADYAKAPVKMMKSLGIINGVGENRFEPSGVSTRAMAAKVIYEMRKVVAQ